VIVVGVIGVAATVAYRTWVARRPFEWSGTLEAHTIEVGSRVGGRVREVRVREGDAVQPGQVLVVLEAGDLDGQRLAAEGQLEQAEAALERLQVGHGGSARADEIAAARSRLSAQQSVLTHAETELRRTEQLYTNGAAARSELDAARATYQNASAERSALNAQLDQLLRATPVDVKGAEGQVVAARGRLEEIDASLDELQVRAPLPSRVESLDLRPGDLLAPGAKVARLLEPDQLFVRIYVPETQLGYIYPGLEVPISVDAFEQRTFKAVVESVRDEGEFTPRNLQTADERANEVFAARLRLEEGRDVLRAGMAAFVRVRR
jgi:multidrug resistance efflux pump